MLEALTRFLNKLLAAEVMLDNVNKGGKVVGVIEGLGLVSTHY